MLSHVFIENKSIHNIFFATTQVNKILNNSNYTKILYSTDYITVNGIHYKVNLSNIRYTKYFNKYFIAFDNVPTELYDILSLEKYILHKQFPTKQPIYKMFNIIQQKQLHFYSYKNVHIDHSCELILKISGIWSNESECGLTIRIYPSVITK